MRRRRVARRLPSRPFRSRRAFRDEEEIMDEYGRLENVAIPMVTALELEIEGLHEQIGEVMDGQRQSQDGVSLMLSMDDPPLEDMYHSIKRIAEQFHHLRKIKVQVNQLNREMGQLGPKDELPMGYHEWPQS